MTTQIEKADRYRALHERAGGFVLPNAWDPGSARLLAGLGFEALATTSSGFARSIGLRDGDLGRDATIAHCKQMSAATHLPINADLENCFADDPAEAAKCITMAAGAGVAGGSIEDYSTDDTKPIYDFNHAVERVAAAVEAARALPGDFVLTARTENYLHGRPDLDDTIRRLQAFEAAGADVLYAPGIASLSEVQALQSALSKPVNVLHIMMPELSIGKLFQAGVKRVSVGGALANVAQGALLTAARDLLAAGRSDATPAETGTNWLKAVASSDDLEALMAKGS